MQEREDWGGRRALNAGWALEEHPDGVYLGRIRVTRVMSDRNGWSHLHERRKQGPGGIIPPPLSKTPKRAEQHLS